MAPRLAQALDRVAAYPYTRKDYARRVLWGLVDKVLIRPSPRRAFGWRRFWLRQMGATLADTARTWPTTRIVHPWLLEVGAHSAVAGGVNVYNLGRIRIGDHTVVSQDAHLCAGTHDYRRPELPLIRAEITIGSGVWVCAEAFVGPGVTVGDNAVVGARAVAGRDVPAWTVVAGNPAAVVKPRPRPAEPGAG
ncbi:MAG: putative colanic acid biosynthesis acetyltransferase [Planctomycetota bacterium]